MKITGIGPVTPAGVGREAFWEGILEPVSRVKVFRNIGTEFGPFVAATVEDRLLQKVIEGVEWPKHVARHTIFAVAATLLALADAGIDRKALKGMAPALVTGTSLMDFGGINKGMNLVARKGARGVVPKMMHAVGLTTIGETINQMLDIYARTMVLQTSCCSGLDAVGYAAQLIADGEADIAICGGTEAPLHRTPLLEFRAAGLTPMCNEMPERLARPFDRWRRTGVVSEGACMFVLEAEESPRPAYCYVTGWGTATDDNGAVCAGLVHAARSAMAAAGRRPADIDSISAWAPGHREIDRGEAKAMLAVFSDRLLEIPAVSLKGALGACLGGAPAIQIAAAALSQRYGTIPPTVNWDFPDPECNLMLSNKPRYVASRTTLVNAHGFGRINSALILER